MQTHKIKNNPNTTLKIGIKSQKNRTKEGNEKTNRNKAKTINKVAIRIDISIITLNVNGLNAPTKRHRLAECIQKQDPYICCLKETHFRSRATNRMKVRGWKNVFHENGNQKKDGVVIHISDKIDFKIKTVTRDKDTTALPSGRLHRPLR